MIPNMHLKVKYEKGVFKPLDKIQGIKEGEQLEFITQESGTFDFLASEEELYNEADLK